MTKKFQTWPEVSVTGRKKMCPRPIDNVNCLFTEVYLSLLLTQHLRNLHRSNFWKFNSLQIGHSIMGIFYPILVAVTWYILCCLQTEDERNYFINRWSPLKARQHEFWQNIPPTSTFVVKNNNKKLNDRVWFFLSRQSFGASLWTLCHQRATPFTWYLCM